MKFILSAAVGSFLSANSGLAAWTLLSSSTSSSHQETDLFIEDNTSASPIDIGFECGGITYHQITGSDATPPWTIKFTPLTDDNFPIHYGLRNGEIPAHTTYRVWLDFDRETGEESWTDGNVVAVRHRLWDSNVQIRSEFIPD